MYRKVAAQELANFLGVIAHPERIRIIEELKSNELDVTALQEVLGIPQASVSRHLGLLKAQNIVEERKEGRRVYYHLTVPLISTWLISGLDIIGEKSAQKVPINKAFEAAKKLWNQKNR